ncbi:hypothetical protein GF343_05540 [Candidatus Woesearchaeota archaeon]|nr:hypothetical protein [Candidatus Woesearchaeota archaeon]
MVFKRIKSGLITLAALAALLAPGCSEKTNTEYIYPENTQQIPTAALKAVSDDGEYAALSMKDKTDLEAMLFSAGTGTTKNMSNSPLASDFARTFAGHNLVTTTRDEKNNAQIKIYNTAGDTIFTSDKFNWVNDVISYPDNTKIIFNGTDYDHYSHVHSHTIGSQSAEKLFPDAKASYVEVKSQDDSVIFMYAFSPSNGDTLYMLKTADDTITPIVNLPANQVFEISKNNATAILYDWNNQRIKTVDTATADVQAADIPAGKQFQNVDRLSETGLGAMLQFGDTATGKTEFWHFNTQNRTLDFVTERATGTAHRYPMQISPDGKTTVFSKHDSSTGDGVLIHNADTSDLYNPIGTATTWADCRGFSSDGKAIIQYDDSATGDNKAVLHDTETKTNTALGDAANYRLHWCNDPTPARNHLPINAADLSTGWNVVLLEDLANSGRKVISQAGIDLEYMGASPDSKYILLKGKNNSSQENPANLFVYNIEDEELTQATHNTDPRLDWIYLSMHSKDGSNAYFEEKFDNGTSLVKELDYETLEVKEVAYQ